MRECAHSITLHTGAHSIALHTCLLVTTACTHARVLFRMSMNKYAHVDMRNGGNAHVQAPR